jgi:thioredoxin reductase (NADPH)
VEKLILATGGTDHPRRLNIPGEDRPHVSHYFREGTRISVSGC